MSGDMMQTIQRLEREVAQLRTQIRRPNQVVEAWMAMRTIPLLFPNLRGVWLMNQWAPGFIYDLTGQARHMSTNGTVAFQQHTNNLLRYLTLDGSSTYLSRASEAGLEITGSLSVIGWFYKSTAGTQFPLISKTSSLSGSANMAWLFTIGSSDNLNLTVCNGTTATNATTPAPAGEWVCCAGNYSPGTFVQVFLGTRDGWSSGQNTTSIPASINNPTAVGVTIGALHGGSSFASGNCAMVAIMNSTSNETLFRNFFEHTKGAFF
jgi:hypothetical protein